MTSNPGAYPSASSPVVAPTIDPRAAALLAAEARSRQPVFDPHAASTSASAHSNRQTIEFNPSAADKLPFHRLLDTEVRFTYDHLPYYDLRREIERAEREYSG